MVFQSLLAGDWDQAHAQAKLISSTYNVVQFFDTPSDRIHYVLMEGIPGQIPTAAAEPPVARSPSRPIRHAEGGGTDVFAAQPHRPLSISAPHIRDDLETENQAIEAVLGAGGAHALDCRHRSRPEPGRRAVRAVRASLQRGGRVAHGGVCLSDCIRGDLCERHLHVAPSAPRERDVHGGRVPEQRRSECPRYRPHACGEHREGVKRGSGKRPRDRRLRVRQHRGVSCSKYLTCRCGSHQAGRTRASARRTTVP